MKLSCRVYSFSGHQKVSDGLFVLINRCIRFYQPSLMCLIRNKMQSGSIFSSFWTWYRVQPPCQACCWEALVTRTPHPSLLTALLLGARKEKTPPLLQSFSTVHTALFILLNTSFVAGFFSFLVIWLHFKGYGEVLPLHVWVSCS